MNWEDKPTVKKGNFGEIIVEKHLRDKGLIPYKPSYDGAHPFDFMCASIDKKRMVIVDAKAKPRLNAQYDGFKWTGIDIRHYEEYSFLQDKYKVPVHIYFVDELEGRVYGNSLKELKKEVMYMKHYKKPTIIFKLDNTKHVAFLTEDQIKELKSLSTRNPIYNIDH